MAETTGSKVLVIDDEPEIGELIRLILDWGRTDEVKSALGGRQGLIAAEQDPPDLIILDIMLPDLDGYEVYQRLRKIPALHNVPILFQSAKSPQIVYPKAQQLGAIGYILLPYTPQELLAARDAALMGKPYYPPLPEEPD